jgi:hypothetical protein
VEDCCLDAVWDYLRHLLLCSGQVSRPCCLAARHTVTGASVSILAGSKALELLVPESTSDQPPAAKVRKSPFPSKARAILESGEPLVGLDLTGLDIAIVHDSVMCERRCSTVSR